MNKQLTDEQIKKTWECCHKGFCTKCPLKEELHCVNMLYEVILDLINRLQAENKQLKR